MDDKPEFATAKFVKDPETGEILSVERDLEYSRAIAAFHNAECQHPNVSAFRVRIANALVQVRNCCLACGERVGTALPQKDKEWVASLPMQTDEHAATYKSRRETDRQTILLDLARRQYAERGRFTKSYSE